MRRMDVKTPYYEDSSRINNSSLGYYLNKGPKYLYDVLTGKIKETPSKAMEKGTMIHAFLLQPEEFKKQYVISDMLVPTTENQKSFCNEYANSLEIDLDLAAINAYKASYKTKGLSNEKIITKAKELVSDYSRYIDFLKQKDTRIIINTFDEKMLSIIYSNIMSHKAAKQILFPEKETNTCNEFHINWKCENVLCKSLLDKITIDSKNKICYITDLKTTSHIYDFESSVIAFDYLRQLCFYYLAARWYLENFAMVENIGLWDFKFNIVAISTEDYSIRVFRIKNEDVFSKKQLIFNTLRAINWHMTNNTWDHYLSYYTNDGYETLNFEKHV